MPKQAPLEMLAPLGCGIITGAGAIINSLGVGIDDSVAVFGTGSVGLSAIMAAKLVGAGAIIAVDLVESRLAPARQLGATHAINPQHNRRRRPFAACCRWAWISSSTPPPMRMYCAMPSRFWRRAAARHGRRRAQGPNSRSTRNTF